MAVRFAELRAERDTVRPGSPIFALEHGLSLDDELPALQEAVRRAVRGPRLPRSSGLPFVVYAAEIGYGYRGDEYWPVFEEATPNWTSHGIDNARRFIRHRFEEFADAYGGARISGRWALWFKNIAWPITHAVLAKDLQRHLARLLYDYRHALTADLLNDHAVLGEELAQRSYDTSARFRKFAENTELLGLVAAALLVGEEDDTPLLTLDVLRRIVSDLSRERQAGAWLLDAKRAAVRIRRKGWMRGDTVRDSSRTTATPTGSQERLEAILSVRRTPEGWKGYVQIPSHEPLAQRFPSVRSELEHARYRVFGVAGSMPRGALLYDRGPLPFERWPSSDGQSLIELDAPASGGSARALLTDHCRLPAGPWLFRSSEPGIAVFVRSRTVRPGASYLLVARDDPQIDAIESSLVEFASADARAIRFTVPEAVTQGMTDGLLAAGLSVAPEVSVSPVGLVPAAWDGEGLAEWAAGESPLVAVRSSSAVACCVVASDTDAKEITWPPGSDTLFLQLADLPPGSHVLSVALVSESKEVLTQGNVTLRIRQPVDSSSSVSARQGMQVKSFPPHPTLGDLWSGSSRLEVTGPEGERVQFDVQITRLDRGRPLGTASFSSLLPVGEERWSHLFRGAQKERGLGTVIDEADEIVVRVEHPGLGSSEVRAGRPFEPLRWSVGLDRDGPFARLVNHSADHPAIQFFPAEHPATPNEIAYEVDGVLRFEHGGLLLARCGDLKAAVILPPHVSGGLDSLSLLNVDPKLRTGPRTVDSVLRCVALAHLWGQLATAGDGTATHIKRRVLEAIKARIGGLIGGQYWWDVERKLLDGATPTSEILLAGIARGAAEQQLAKELLRRRAMGWDSASLIDFYSEEVAVSCRWLDQPSARVVARLAGNPEGLDDGDGDVAAAIGAALRRPAIFRLARLIAAAESISPADQGSRS